ncbi:hypothetical protein KBC04_03765 [Candidatus Babeliales bacterium]|nr:hypothetical protein [Candidatus Babeliales bacterium]MBP9844185.1 hypothetical protein [Candidatus Babeliales bacterium]
MKFIKIMLISSALFANLSSTSDKNNFSYQNQQQETTRSSYFKSHRMEKIRARLHSSNRALKFGTIIFGIATYANYVLNTTQDFTKLPEFSTEHFKSYSQKWATTLDNTSQSLGINQAISDFYDVRKQTLKSLHAAKKDQEVQAINNEKNTGSKEIHESLTSRDSNDTTLEKPEIPSKKLSQDETPE